MQSEAPHPRHRAIAHLTALVAQAEETVARYRVAVQKQTHVGSNLWHLQVLLRMAEQRAAMLRQSRDHVLADAEPEPRRTRRSARSDTPP